MCFNKIQVVQVLGLNKRKRFTRYMFLDISIYYIDNPDKGKSNNLFPELFKMHR